MGENGTSSSNGAHKRIAKNTLILYFRHILIMLVSLYTARVVLETLGVEDYGIYNVVGGVVAMLAFLNSTLASSTQRFLNIEMVSNNKENLSETFSTAVIGHYLIAGIILILAETVGLYFVMNKLVIPEERLTAALFVYQFSVFSFIIAIISTPYNAIILANEKMNIFAYISLLEVSLKLISVFLLVYINYDKLILYSLFIFLIALFLRLIYRIYCRRNFEESNFRFLWSIKLLKQMFSFSGWMLAGTTTNILSLQGVNILINMFFGPAFNAARAIAMQVNSATKAFVENIMIATRPQIIKSYTEKRIEYTYKLVFLSSRISFFLLSLLVIPILFQSKLILSIWLKTTPDYSALFTQLILVDTLISALFAPLGTLSQASGKIKAYQISIALTFFCVFAFTYIVYKLGYPVSITFVISIVMSLIGLFFRVLILYKTVCFPIGKYLKEVIFPIFYTTMFSLIIPLSFKIIIQDNSVFVQLLFTFTCLLSSAISIWFVGLRREEKGIILERLNRVLKRLQK